MLIPSTGLSDNFAISLCNASIIILMEWCNGLVSGQSSDLAASA